MNLKDKIQEDNEKYRKAFKQFGQSPKSLLWMTDRRNIRYYELLKNLPISPDTSLLDVGCGFADLFKFCEEYLDTPLHYTGIDYCNDFIDTAKEYADGQCSFIQGDFLSLSDSKQYDFCITSGIFNLSNGMENKVEEEFLYSVVNKMFHLCNIGISFNFVTDKVDYRNMGVSYYSPAKILDFCYSLSRNLIFDNSCMPFEATVTVFKDSSFSKSRIFHSFERNHAEEFQNGIFIAAEKENPKG